MSAPRIWVEGPLEPGRPLRLPEGPAHHLGRVLRLRPGDAVLLFDGQGMEHPCRISAIGRAGVEVQVGEGRPVDRESPLELVLVQGISRGERMDYTIQKAVELGVAGIVPVACVRSTVRLNEERRRRRLEHWRAVVIGACEQCGRNRLPVVAPVQTLEEWLRIPSAGLRLLLRGDAAAGPGRLAAPTGPVTLLAGPEGGFTAAEVAMAEAAGFRPLRLGPRVLRTETAAVATLAVLQNLWGDFR